MAMDKIEHVVVLMLENRSFDSMLGWLYEKDRPSLCIAAAKSHDAYRGLQSVDLGKFENTALDGKLTVRPIRGAQGFTVPTVDPGEEFDHVNAQFFGTTTPKDGQPATMTGVLSDFVAVLQERTYARDDIVRLAPMVMETYTPAQLPVLSQLARHYAVSDEWFASVPSQTNPNRAFLLCGTSNGMVNNGFLETDPRAAPIERALHMMIGDDRVDAPTILNQLAADGKDWAVFWQTSYLPQKISTLIDTMAELLAFLNVVSRFVGPLAWVATIADAALAMLGTLEGLSPAELEYLRELSAGDLHSSYTWRLFPQISQKIPGASSNFQSLDDFHTRARNGTLPAFSYIEPYWSIARATTGNAIGERLISALGNDYHPPSNLLVGEEFVKDVYTSLISNTDAWHKTLLLITFDEFVGTFDHVTDHLGAGTVAPPWGATGQAPKCEEGFKFDRLGGRVATILVSPYIQKGTVFRSAEPVPYDHTSVISTTMKWIGREAGTTNFGSRAANAPTFENVLTLSEPRTDEADLLFLDTERSAGDPLRYGDSLWLRNQSGDYLTSAYATLKFAGGGAVVPRAGIDLLADIGIAAYFPRYGSGETIAVTLVSHSPDPGPQVGHRDTVRLVSREPQLGSRNVLGAWPDSSDCYYYDEYVDGDNAGRQAWTIENVDPAKGSGVCYGDNVYLLSASTDYGGQRLTRDTRWLNTDNWITTSSSGGDSWTIVPAPARVGRGSG
jgi:phospholipase C